jgi:hypothetical protein
MHSMSASMLKCTFHVNPEFVENDTFVSAMRSGFPYLRPPWLEGILTTVVVPYFWLGKKHKVQQ